MKATELLVKIGAAFTDDEGKALIFAKAIRINNTILERDSDLKIKGGDSIYVSGKLKCIWDDGTIFLDQ